MRRSSAETPWTTSACPGTCRPTDWALVEHGVLERRPYSERPSRHEDRLTAKGLYVHPVLVSIAGWGDRWMAGQDGPALRLRHQTCGDIRTGPMIFPRRAGLYAE